MNSIAETFGPTAATMGGGFFAGILIGYALKKVIKIAAIVVGLFLAGLAGRDRNVLIGLPLYGIVHKYKVSRKEEEQPLPITSTTKRYMNKIEIYRSCWILVHSSDNRDIIFSNKTFRSEGSESSDGFEKNALTSQ